MAPRLSTIYLFIYNTVQLIGFTSVTLYLARSLLTTEKKSSLEIYRTIGPQFILFQALQLSEVVHIIIGLTRGSPVIPLIQIGGRNLILHILINDNPSLHREWFVPWLLLAWSSIEVFRYPFYLTSTMGSRVKLITFLRYTAWAPLYPLGILLEAVTINSGAKLLEKSGKYSILLPNPANISFYLPGLLKLYLYVLIWPTAFLLLTHMYKQSRRALKNM